VDSTAVLENDTEGDFNELIDIPEDKAAELDKVDARIEDITELEEGETEVEDTTRIDELETIEESPEEVPGCVLSHSFRNVATACGLGQQ
jgi:hypothetical protein